MGAEGGHSRWGLQMARARAGFPMVRRAAVRTSWRAELWYRGGVALSHPVCAPAVYESVPVNVLRWGLGDVRTVDSDRLCVG